MAGAGTRVPWHIVNAEGKVRASSSSRVKLSPHSVYFSQTVGRLATQIATVLRGKHKPTYAPNVDCGDYVVVINAENVVLTGKKTQQKLYRWHTGFPGGLKERTAREQLQRRPEEVLRSAVYGMLPKNKMRAVQAKKLRIFAGDVHPHAPQITDDGSHFE
jgi:large subunit ribosomal protein L13